MVAGALLTSLPQHLSAELYNATNDFSASPTLPATSANLVWSYGYSTGSGFVLDTVATAHSPLATNSSDSIPSYYFDGASNPNLPAILKNNSGGLYSFLTISNWDPAYLLIHPGQNNEQSILRFTAPSNSSYNIAAAFIGLDSHGTSSDVHVIVTNAGAPTAAFDALVLPSANYSGNVFLAQGDTVDFAVGYGANGNYYYDSTGLNAEISSTPEPGSLALLAGGFIGFAILQVRRSSLKSFERKIHDK